MWKKSLIVASLLNLSACSLFSEPQSPIPAEFAGADYQLSDSNAKRWVEKGNQVEQCVYPNLTRIQQSHFSKEDAFVYSQYVFFYPLEEIVGAENLSIIKADQKSMDYVTYQRKKFKHLTADPLPDNQCNVLRKQARDDLAVMKGEYRSAMVDEKRAEESTSHSGSSTLEKSKFSFDILKWGIGLMLL